MNVYECLDRNVDLNLPPALELGANRLSQSLRLALEVQGYRAHKKLRPPLGSQVAGGIPPNVDLDMNM